MSILRLISARLRRFTKAEDGVITTEVIIILPVLIWTFLALFVFWDAFRVKNNTIKASYTLSDMISRETKPVTQTYLNGMHKVFQYMVDAGTGTNVRVTSIRYTLSNDSFTVLGGLTTDSRNLPKLNNTTLAAVKSRLPRPADSDTLLIVETWRDYRPAFWVGLNERTFYEFVVVRPRFISPLPIS